MRLFARITSFAAFLAIGMLALAPTSRAVAPQHIEQSITIGTATVAVPVMLTGICGYSIYNGDSATIFIGFSSSVNNTTGIPILAATSFPITLTYAGAGGGTQVYLYSVAGTSAGAVLWKGCC